MIEATSHSGRRLSKQRSCLSGRAHEGFGKISNDSISSRNGDNQENSKKSKGRSRSQVSRHITSRILGPTIGDTLIGTVEFAGPLLSSVTSRRKSVAKERRSTHGSSAEYHGRTVSSADSFERRRRERHPEKATGSRGSRDAAVDQLRMLLSPRLDDVILETAAICCCCCRSKMAARLEQDVRQWKQELKEAKEGGKKPRESIECKRRRREEDEPTGEPQRLDDEKGMDEDQMDVAENGGRPRKSTARRSSREERKTTPFEILMENESLKMARSTSFTTSKEEEPPVVAEEEIAKEPNEVPSEPLTGVPQRMSRGVQMSDNEIFLAQVDLTTKKVSTQNQMSQTEEQEFIIPTVVNNAEPEKENTDENQSEGQMIVTSTPIARKPCKTKKKTTERVQYETPSGGDRDVMAAMSLSKGLVETIALQARAIGGALELGTSLLPKERAATSEAYSSALHGSPCWDRNASRGWFQQDSLQESRSFNRIQNSTMNENAARCARRKPCPAGRFRSPIESPIPRRPLSTRCRTSMVSIQPHPTCQERKPICGRTSQDRSRGICQEPRNDHTPGGETSPPVFLDSMEEGPLGSSTMCYSSYVEEEEFKENESGRKPPFREKVAELSDETPHKMKAIGGQRLNQSTEKCACCPKDDNERINNLVDENCASYSTPGNRLPHPLDEEIRGKDITPKKHGQCSDREAIVRPIPERLLNRCNQNSSFKGTTAEEYRWLSDDKSPIHPSQDQSLKMSTEKRRDNKGIKYTWPYEDRLSIPRLSSIRFPFPENSDRALTEQYRSYSEKCPGYQQTEDSISHPIESKNYDRVPPQIELRTQPSDNEKSCEDPCAEIYNYLASLKPPVQKIPDDSARKSLKDETNCETAKTEGDRVSTDKKPLIQLEEDECITEYMEKVTGHSATKTEDRRRSSDESCVRQQIQSVESDRSDEICHENLGPLEKKNSMLNGNREMSPRQSNKNEIKFNESLRRASADGSSIYNEEPSDAGNNGQGTQGRKEVPSPGEEEGNKNDKEYEDGSGEISGGRKFSEKGGPGEENGEKASEVPARRPPPISTCFVPRCSDAGLAREDDCVVSRGHTSTREKNLIEVEEIPSPDGKTAKVITRKEKVTEEKKMEFRDATPPGDDFYNGAAVKTDAEESTEQPSTKRNSFLEMLKRKRGYKRSRRTSEVAVTPVGKLSTTIEEEETVEARSTVKDADTKPKTPSNVRFDDEIASQKSPKVGNVWDVESGEKILENPSETSLHFPVRDRTGSVVGYHEMDLTPSRSERRTRRVTPVEEERGNETKPCVMGARSNLEHGGPTGGRAEDPRQTSSSTAATTGDYPERPSRCQLRRDRRMPACGQRSARVLWAIARINDYGGGERTLEIVETNKKRPATRGREPKCGKEVIVIAPP